jgi:hypothetical protein
MAGTIDGTKKCRVCGCTDLDCTQCVQRTGQPCHWVESDLCSACDFIELPNPVDIPQGWLAVFCHGRDVDKFRIHRIKYAVAIRIDEPNHTALMQGILPPDVKSKRERAGFDKAHGFLIVWARRFPWEDRPQIRGIGELLCVQEFGQIPIVDSSDVIRNIQEHFN